MQPTTCRSAAARAARVCNAHASRSGHGSRVRRHQNAHAALDTRERKLSAFDEQRQRSLMALAADLSSSVLLLLSFVCSKQVRPSPHRSVHSRATTVRRRPSCFPIRCSPTSTSRKVVLIRWYEGSVPPIVMNVVARAASCSRNRSQAPTRGCALGASDLVAAEPGATSAFRG